jgi:hypothetical protein
MAPICAPPGSGSSSMRRPTTFDAVRSPRAVTSSASAAPRRRLYTASTSPRRTKASSSPITVWAGDTAMSIVVPCTRSA